MNITDVDDKIIRDAAAAGIAIGELTERHTAHVPRGPGPAAHHDARHHAPGDRAHRRHGGPDRDAPRAGPCLPHRRRLDLLPHRLAGRRTADWRASTPTRNGSGERVEADEYDKDDVRDFALWKAAKPGEPSWSTAVGEGRPGWHIECSAMSMRYLGPSFDIHTGGVDLVFPHHEDEIAQSEAATGQPFVRTWLHCAHLQMGGQKMAKRVGQPRTAGRAVRARGHRPRALRYALLATHYRSPLEFSDDVARRGDRRRRAAVHAALALGRLSGGRALTTRRCRALLAAARDGVRGGARGRPQRLGGPGCAVRPRARPQRAARRAVPVDRGCPGRRRRCRDLDRVLAVIEDDPRRPAAERAGRCSRSAPQARAARDWARSDALRAELADHGRPRGGHRGRPALADDRGGRGWRRDADDRRTTAAAATATATAAATPRPGRRGRGDRGGDDRPMADHGQAVAAVAATRRRRPAGSDRARRAADTRPPGRPIRTTRRAGRAVRAGPRPGRRPRPGGGIATTAVRDQDRPTGGSRRPWTPRPPGPTDTRDRARRPSRGRRPPRPARPRAARRPTAGAGPAPSDADRTRLGPYRADRPAPGGPARRAGWPSADRPRRTGEAVARRDRLATDRVAGRRTPAAPGTAGPAVRGRSAPPPTSSSATTRRSSPVAARSRRRSRRVDRPRRLLVVPERRSALEQLVLHATTLRIPVVEVEGGTLTSLSGFDGHQGVALVVEPRRWATLDEVLARARERARAAVRARPRLPRGSAERRHAAAHRGGVPASMACSSRRAARRRSARRPSRPRRARPSTCCWCPLDDLAGGARRPPRPRPPPRRRRRERTAHVSRGRPARTAGARRRQRGARHLGRHPSSHRPRRADPDARQGRRRSTPRSPGRCSCSRRSRTRARPSAHAVARTSARRSSLLEVAEPAARRGSRPTRTSSSSCPTCRQAKRAGEAGDAAPKRPAADETPAKRREPARRPPAAGDDSTPAGRTPEGHRRDRHDPAEAAACRKAPPRAGTSVVRPPDRAARRPRPAASRRVDRPDAAQARSLARRLEPTRALRRGRDAVPCARCASARGAVSFSVAADVAQLVEQRFCKPPVPGSSPVVGSN